MRGEVNNSVGRQNFWWKVSIRIGYADNAARRGLFGLRKLEGNVRRQTAIGGRRHESSIVACGNNGDSMAFAATLLSAAFLERR